MIQVTPSSTPSRQNSQTNHEGIYFFVVAIFTYYHFTPCYFISWPKSKVIYDAHQYLKYLITDKRHELNNIFCILDRWIWCLFVYELHSSKYIKVLYHLYIGLKEICLLIYSRSTFWSWSDIQSVEQHYPATPKIILPASLEPGQGPTIIIPDINISRNSL